MKLLVVQFQPSRSSLDGPWIDIYSKGLQNASPTRDKHMYTTCLEVGAFVDIEISLSSIQFPEESRKPSSFFQDQAPDGPLDQQSSTCKPKPQRPLEESIHRSSFINCSSSRIKPQRPLWIDNINESAHPLFIKPKPRRPLKKAFIVHHCSSRSSPKALGDPFKPKSSRRFVRHCSSSSSPKALGDPFITVLQRSSPKAHLKIRSKPPSRSSPRPLKNVHP
ncbi:hypothetical protein FF1_016214 [Malus domestica]